MTRRRQRVGGFVSTSPRPGRSDALPQGDFAWPPPIDDPDACSVVALDGESVLDAVPARAVLDNDPWAAFPEIDPASALDLFGELPAVTHVVAPQPLAIPRDAHVLELSASSWRTGAIRALVAVCIGASMAVAPSPAARHAPDTGPAFVPVIEPPRVSKPRALAKITRVRVAPEPRPAEPRAGKVVAGDEDRVRATLADLQAAYSRLDADATHEVWPTVDMHALVIAFGALKSQELRFDHCDVTVDGPRARAACTGEAVSVSRVDDPAPSSAARAWTFELTRTREGWTIASARAS